MAHPRGFIETVKWLFRPCRFRGKPRVTDCSRNLSNPTAGSELAMEIAPKTCVPTLAAESYASVPVNAVR